MYYGDLTDVVSVLRIAYLQVSTEFLGEVLGLSAGELDQFIAAQPGWKVQQETGLIALPQTPASAVSVSTAATVTTTATSDAAAAAVAAEGSSSSQRTKRHQDLDKKKMASILATLSK